MIDRPTTRSLRLLAIGTAQGDDMRFAVEQLESLADCRHVPSIGDATSVVQADAPHWICLLQSRTGQFAPRDVESLHQIAPLARLILVVGQWSEGETRSGTPLAGVFRVAWHHLPYGLLWERAAWEGGIPSRLALPRTSRLVDRVESYAQMNAPNRSKRDAPSNDGERSLVIVADHREAFESLAESCRAAGWSSRWLRSTDAARDVGGPLVWIWGAWSEEFAREAAGWHRDAPSLILTDFPRAAACGAIRRAGWDIAGRPLDDTYLAAWAGLRADHA
ncbi:MAG TPA: hypothetical protein ENJ50_10000 [Planctomycetaceae bacterium]|nr:hypothetical protein [Planctomycetaceae bacterium]